LQEKPERQNPPCAASWEKGQSHNFRSQCRPWAAYGRADDKKKILFLSRESGFIRRLSAVNPFTPRAPLYFFIFYLDTTVQFLYC